MNKKKEKIDALTKFEQRVIALAKIDASLVNDFIIKHQYDGESLIQAEIAQAENKALDKFEQRVIALAKIDSSLVNDFIIKHQYNVDKSESFIDSANIANRIFKLCKQTRTINLAYELAKNQQIDEKSLNFTYNNGYVEFMFFHTLNHNFKNFKKIFTLSNVLKFVNQHSNKIYNSDGHVNYLLQTAKKAGLK